MKPKHPNIIDRLKQRAAPAPATMQINAQDIANVLIAARKAIGGFNGVDLVNIAGSIANLDAFLAAVAPKPATSADAKPADKPAEKPKG